MSVFDPVMSQDQTLLLANGEEDDESFREKDFEEAAAYCSRSGFESLRSLNPLLVC